MARKFVVYRDKARKFRFRLLAANGEIIAVGEAYESKVACINGIKSIKKNAPVAEIIDKTVTKETAEKKPAKKTGKKLARKTKKKPAKKTKTNAKKVLRKKTKVQEKRPLPKSTGARKRPTSQRKKTIRQVNPFDDPMQQKTYPTMFSVTQYFHNLDKKQDTTSS